MHTTIASDTATTSDDTAAISQRLRVADIALVGPHHVHIQCSACGSIWSPVMAADASFEDEWWRCPRGCNSDPGSGHVGPLEERRARWREIKQARDQGKTLEQVGGLFGITRQRVSAILKTGEPRPNGRPRKAVSA